MTKGKTLKNTETQMKSQNRSKQERAKNSNHREPRKKKQYNYKKTYLKNSSLPIFKFLNIR